MKKPTPEEVLSCNMGEYSKDISPNMIVEEYLLELLRQVVIHQEGFDGKRPFGNSDWMSNDIGMALATSGVIESSTDWWGDLEFSHTDVGDAVFEAVASMEESLWRLRELDNS